jgi:hypothetical protein
MRSGSPGIDWPGDSRVTRSPSRSASDRLAVSMTTESLARSCDGFLLNAGLSR